ncbi:helix-turn-helix domain-containing protein [Streptomyces sp. NBC_00151]|uniref:helix-turn-helix domain-containing protein n=1 Tax=Streptomyces sp. NBC_00151 TaxID=2975669 RepID=UPI003FA3B177
MPAHSPFTVVWDKNQRATLKQLAHSRTASLQRIQRAEVALAAADGASNAAIARSHRLHIATVRRWRKRFHYEGMAALNDRRKPGRPRRYGPEVHLAIVATVTSAKSAPTVNRPTSQSPSPLLPTGSQKPLSYRS